MYTKEVDEGCKYQPMKHTVCYVHMYVYVCLYFWYETVGLLVRALRKGTSECVRGNG